MFFKNMMLAAEQVGILYIIVAVGFFADKFGLYTEKTAKKCTDLLFYIVTPAKIIESFFTLEYSSESVKGLFIALGCGFLLHTVAAIVSCFVFNKCDIEKAVIFKYAGAYSNAGYMGLPLANAIFGTEGVFYCSAVIISFQIFCFTHGVYVMNKGKTEGKKGIEFKKLIFNPGVIGVVIGMPIFLLSLNLPEIIAQPIAYVGSLNSPLAMLIFGTYIAHTNFKTIFKEWRILAVAFVKLILMPAIMLGLYKLIGISGVLLGSLMVSASAPSATNTTIFAAKYERDAGLASQTVAVISFLSILTMPVVIAVSQQL